MAEPSQLNTIVFCLNCGLRLDPSAAECPRCGEPTRAREEVDRPPAPEKLDYPPPRPKLDYPPPRLKLDYPPPRPKLDYPPPRPKLDPSTG
jgi:ribosomal protein L40E